MTVCAHLIELMPHISAPTGVKVHVFIVDIYLCVHQSHSVRITLVVDSPDA